jgi:hypothetical protein
MWWWLLACRQPTPLVAPTGDTGEVDPPEVREWVDVSSWPCGLDSDGVVTCWSSAAWSARDNPNQFLVAIDRVVTQGGRLHAVPSPANVVVHRIGEVPDVLHCSNPRSSGCYPPVALEQMTGWAGGIDVEGQLHWWGDAGYDVYPADGYHALATGSDSAVNARNEVFYMWSTDPLTLALPPDLEVTQLVAQRVLDQDSPDELGACVLDVTGAVTCVGDNPLGRSVFENPPYRFLDGGGMVACAVRAVDDGIECTDGTTYDLGPLRRLSVHPLKSDATTVDEEEASLCAITMDNAIVCRGPHYGDDLHATLAALPR